MSDSLRHRRPSLVVAVVALIAALTAALAFGAYSLQSRANERLLSLAVETRANQVSMQLSQLQLNVEHGLRGARSILIAAGGLGKMGADSFSNYQLTSNLAREYPGVKGLGLVRLVPWGAGGGTRMLVQFVEPVDKNSDLQGLDLASHPAVQAVAVSALATGEIQLASLHLGGSTQLLALMALRLPGKAEEGWAMAALKMPDLLAALQLPGEQLALRVQQAEPVAAVAAAPAAGPALQDLAPVPEGCVAQASNTHTAFGRPWVLTLCAKPAFQQQLRATSPAAAAAGAALVASTFGGFFLTLGAALRRGRQASVAQQRLASYVAQAGDAVVTTDAQGVITAWNPAASRCFGWAAQQALGQPLATLLLAGAETDPHAQLLAQQRALLLAGQPVVSQEMQARHRDGAMVELTVSQTALVNDDNGVEGVSYTFVDITARKLLEREEQSQQQRLAGLVAERTSALEAARHDLQAVIDAMPSLVSYYDLSFTCQFANAAHRDWLGLDPQTLPGRKLAELVDAETLQLINPLMQDAAAGIARRVYRDFPRADGTGTRRVLAHYQPVLQQGQVRGLFVLIHDVDELHRSQQALALEQERLLNIVRSTDAGTWEWDIAENRLTVNQRYQEITGRPVDATGTEPLGRRIDTVHPDDLQGLRQRIKAHLRGNTELFEMESRIQRGNGQWVWVRDTGRVSDRDAQGRALRAFGTTLDITQRKQAEQQVLDNERRFRFFSDNVEEGILVAEHGVIVDVSEVLARMFRGAAADIVGRSPLQFMAPPLQGDGNQASDGTELQPSEPYETRLQRADGSSFPALVRSRDVRTGERTVRLMTVLDISRQKQTEAALLQARADAERASQAKSQFLANMSHEIRTPLNAVIGLSYLFQDTALNSAQRVLVGKIQLAGRSLLSLINDVLDLSKIEAGEMELDRRTFELPEVLNDIVRLLSSQAEAKGLALHLQLSPELHRFVWGDELRLRQILLNLVGNAIKFTDSGSVTLAAMPSPPRDTPLAAAHSPVPGAAAAALPVRFEVRDTGIGIAPDALPRLFTAFTQADSSNARRFSGTGLGLSIVRQLAELMGGHAGADSRIGAGSCFWVELSLPLADSADRRGLSAPLAVLVAEDDAAQRDQIENMARSLGWHVETVHDGASLVQRASALRQANRAPDALLVDWKMPGLDGLAALSQLHQALGPAAVPPAVVLSSSDAADVQAAPHAKLADAVLTKPVSASALFNAINAAVVRQQGSHERLLASTRLEGSNTQWLAGVKVLVVDDSDINLEVARHLLERQGAQVCTAPNGKLGLDLLQQQTVDAVLMDVQMPVMDGNEATRQARQLPHLKTLPIIALTAGALLAERQRALDAGMTDFLTKPLDPDQLVRALRRHIERARGRPLDVQAREPAPQPPGEPAPGGGPEPANPLPWPLIAGIDAEEAQTRLGHDRGLLLRLLKRLLGEFRHAAEAPAQGWGAAIDTGALPARMHKLRGAAGMVAAGTVQRLAGEAEMAARQPEGAASLAQLMPALDRALQDLETQAEPWLRAADATASAADVALPQAPLNVTAVAALREQLQRSDLAALETARVLDAPLRQRLGPVRHAQWRELIDALDFRQAEALLQASGSEAPPDPRTNP